MFSPKGSIFSAWASKLLPEILLLITFLFTPMLIYAQNHARLQTRETSRKGKYYSRQSATITAQKSYMVEPGFTFTSLSLRIAPSQDFAGAYIVSEKDTFFLQQDEHQPEEDAMKLASLVILEKPVQSVLFYPGHIKGRVIFSFINAATGQRQEILQRKNHQDTETLPEEGCSKPALIPQAEWRAGLPPPHYTRIATLVQHVIVHHSAGSNTATDYVNIVRNIYLFHTMDHGWSDIGYNFLIAQDGTIFEGRSTGGQLVEQDNIQGAHFCGKNSGTMGICLLGNYNTAVPTEAALSSLVKLTAWKLDKEGLDPFNTIPHPANASLGVIAGHRDGCATECPGDHLYARLDEIRLRVQAQINESCQQTFVVYPVPSGDILHIAVPPPAISYDIFLYDTQGQKINAPVYQENGQWVIDIKQLTDGVYVVRVEGKDFHKEQKIILSHPS